ncbi:MAG: DCC1-like thiol-disulfide oxidoreductase family protein [Acidobacteriota bacterium]
MGDRGQHHGPTEAETLFYDGDCGVCHWAVEFVARRDRAGQAFRFAPLGGEKFLASLDEKTRSSLPDSILVLRRSGELLTRSSAAIYILRTLGGPWSPVGGALWLVPKPLRDLGYDLFARIRGRLVAPPSGVCPVMPPELRARFDA